MTERKIKILFSIGRFSVGGAEKLLVHQLGALDRDRFDDRLITLFREQKDTFADRVRIHRCFNARSGVDPIALWRVYRYLRRERFDVVVTSLFSANLLVRLAAVLARVPVVIAYEHNIYPNKHRWQIFMDRQLAKHTDRIIISSEAARSFTAKQESIPLEKFLTMFIPPLLDDSKQPRPADEMRAELGIAREDHVILTVSRLIEDKGHSFLVEAAKTVLEDHPETLFLMVGWGPQLEPLKDQVERLGIGARVLLPGRLDIRDVLPLAQLYVDPSLSTDLPVALMEAMREGKPIVATSIGEIPLFIRNGETGLIVPPRDAQALAASLKRLLADITLQKKLGDAARTFVAEYSLERYMRSFEDLVANYAKIK